MQPSAGGRQADRARVRSRSRRWLIDHGFDVVAIGIENEAGVIIRSILRSWTGSTIVLGTGLERGLERVDVRLPTSSQGDVQARQRRLAVRLLDLE